MRCRIVRASCGIPSIVLCGFVFPEINHALSGCSVTAGRPVFADRYHYLQLFALTGVPPDRQKITAGAKQITDATDLTTIGLKDKQVSTLPTRYFFDIHSHTLKIDC